MTYGATIPRPLANGSTIDVYYYCAGVLDSASTERVVWMLNGGPGGRGLYGYVDQIAELDPSGVYCTTDYRGVGLSSELRCSSATQSGCSINLVRCADEMKATVDFSDYYTTAAAWDVVALVKLGKATVPSAKHALYGVSYGTFWAERVMQLDGDLVDHWVFDGVVLPPWLPNGGWQYGPIQANARILAYLEACIADRTCGQHYDATTHAAFQAYMATLTIEQRVFVTGVLQSHFVRPNDYPNNFVEIVNSVNALVRQGPDDTVKRLARQEPCDSNQIVYYMVKANELYSYDRTNLQFLEWYQQLVLDSGTNDIFSTMPWMQEVVRDDSPLYTSGKVLVLAGDRDLQTDMVNSEVLHLNFESLGVSSMSLVAVNTGHGALFHQAPGDPFCGVKLLIDFTQDLPLQTACLATSTYKTFATATYDVYPPLASDPADAAAGGSTSTTLVGLAVALAVFVVLFIVALGFLVVERRRHAGVAPNSVVLDDTASNI